MLEKKNKQLAIMLVIMIAITAVVTWFISSDRAVVNKDIFRLEDYTTIDKVVLESSGKKVELFFSGSRWKVNGKYNADRDLIDVLFATLQQAEPRRPVSTEQNDPVADLVEKTGTKVTLFEGQQSVQHFYVGGNDSKTQAYFKHANDGQVYLMTIPGYRVYVSGIFELTENQWREKYAFPFNWRNFKSLTATFPGDPGQNFSVRQDDAGIFEIEELVATDTAKLNTFLDHVSLLTVNAFRDDVSLTDSLSESQPQMIITIEDVAKNQYKLEIFEGKGSDVPGVLNEQDGVVFNRLKLRPVVRPRSYFIAR